MASKFLEEIIYALQWSFEKSVMIPPKCLKQFLGLLLAPQLETLNLCFNDDDDDDDCPIDLNSLRCFVRYHTFIDFYISITKEAKIKT